MSPGAVADLGILKGGFKKVRRVSVGIIFTNHAHSVSNHAYYCTFTRAQLQLMVYPPLCCLLRLESPREVFLVLCCLLFTLMTYPYPFPSHPLCFMLMIASVWVLFLLLLTAFSYNRTLIHSTLGAPPGN